MPGAARRMYPARTRSLWLGTSASAGSSRRVRRNRDDIRNNTVNLLWVEDPGYRRAPAVRRRLFAAPPPSRLLRVVDDRALYRVAGQWLTNTADDTAPITTRGPAGDRRRRTRPSRPMRPSVGRRPRAPRRSAGLSTLR